MWFVVCVGCRGPTFGYDAADGHCFVSEHFRHPLQTCRFHLKVCDGTTLVAEAFDFFVEFGVGKLKPHHPSLRGIESHCGDCVASTHVIAAYFIYKSGVGIDGVWGGP